MKTLDRQSLSICGIILMLLSLTVAASAQSSDARRVVIPFDLVSKFDDGRYGAMVADSIWKKLNREGGFIVPDSLDEVRDFCKSRHLEPSPDMPLDKMQKIVREDFDAQIGIWGSVERAPGTDTDVYDLVVKCVDFSAPGTPKTIYEVKARTKTVSEIPHVYEKALIDALYGRTAETSQGADRSTEKLAEEKWISGPNLIAGGDFESGVGNVPKGWEKVGGQQREPLGKLVKWTAEKNSGSSGSQYGENKFIRFSFPAAVGDNEGVMYYSDYFPVEEGATYRFQCRFRTNGPAVKVFIKCYDDTKTGYRSESGKGEKSKSKSKSVGKNENEQRREVYRAQIKLEGPKNVWNAHAEDFTPKHTKYSPKWGRVMLYAYIGAGEVDFDDVIVKQIIPPPANEKPKELKHSSASDVTIKEMEENQRRSKDAEEANEKERKK